MKQAVDCAPTLEELAGGKGFSFEIFVEKSLGESHSNTPVSLSSQLHHAHEMTTRIHFVASLMSISDRLRAVEKAERSEALKGELTLLNFSLPLESGCGVFGCRGGVRRKCHRVVRVAPGEGRVLDSADRVSFSGIGSFFWGADVCA